MKFLTVIPDGLLQNEARFKIYEHFIIEAIDVSVQNLFFIICPNLIKGSDQKGKIKKRCQSGI